MTLRDYIMERVEFDTNGGCWLWSRGRTSDGYGVVNTGGKSPLAHRVAYSVFCAPIPDGAVVMHKCDTPACVNPDHLRVGTQRENIADRHAKGRNGNDLTRKGSRHPLAKLSERDVLAVRKALAGGALQSALTARYGVCQGTISNIASRKTWGHI